MSILSADVVNDDSTKHSSPCLIGLKVSSLEISSLALVHRGTSTTTVQVSKCSGGILDGQAPTVEHGLGLIGKEGDVAADQLGARTVASH